MFSAFTRIPVLLFLVVVTATAFAANKEENPVSKGTIYHGMCDASAGVALDDKLFAVANDEDNTLRIYRLGQGGRPVQSFDLSPFLKVDPKSPETDLEGAAWLGDRIFWIGSHGRNRDGKYRDSRHRFFAINVQKTKEGPRIVPVGKPYTKLLRDLVRDRDLIPFRLDLASRLPPKDPGALNIEGLCATPDNHLLIGFRNPIPQGRALLIRLINPNQVIAGKGALFGEPILLNLGGRGIRDVGFWHGRYLIIAGSFDAEGVSQVYLWKGGKAEPELMLGIDLHKINPEAVIVYPGEPHSFQLLSDDGTKLIGETICKRLTDPMQRQFRSAWVTP